MLAQQLTMEHEMSLDTATALRTGRISNVPLFKTYLIQTTISILNIYCTKEDNNLEKIVVMGRV